MSQQSFWLLVAFLGYSTYSAVIGRVTAFAPPGLVLAVYMSTGAVLSWMYVLATGQQARMVTMSAEQIAAMCGIGVIVFVSDYAYTRLFLLNVPLPVIYGFIAWVAVGTMVIFSLLATRWPSKEEMIGVMICCYGAYVINTGRFGPP